MYVYMCAYVYIYIYTHICIYIIRADLRGAPDPGRQQLISVITKRYLLNAAMTL